MASKRTGRAKPKTNNKPKKVATKQARTALDIKAAEYARLLVDPCSAPLTYPVYPGGDSGYLFRAESFATFGTGVGETSGVIHWVPGYVNSTVTQLIAAAGATSSTSLTLATNASSPGAQFLTNNAKGCRCVAACMKVTYPGAESTRSGRVHYGLTSAGMLDSGNAVTADNVGQALQHFSRTPADTFEVLWKPSIGDTEFNDPTEASGPLIRDRKSAITLAYAGLPAATGLTVHFTAIYEWTPATGLGVGHNPLGKNTSRNTLDQVLDYLIQGGFTFVRHSGQAMGHTLGAALTSGIAQTFGIMPTQPRTRSLAYR